MSQQVDEPGQPPYNWDRGAETFREQMELRAVQAPWFKRKLWWPLKRNLFKPWLRMAKWRFQRARRGYSDIDVWNLSDHLADVIAGGCEQLSKEMHGWPGGYAGISEDEVQGVQEWHCILEKIAAGFRVHDWESDEQKAKFNEGMRLFSIYYGCLWD